MADDNWKSVIRLEKNRKGRDFVCGDIHGCFFELEEKLAQNRFDKKKDRLFCTGDIIDRGPKSDLAAEYLKKPWFFSVLGNHEYMFFMANMDTPESDNWLFDHIKNGGSWIYKLDRHKADELIDAVIKLPLVIQAGNALIVHAAFPPVDSLEKIEKKPDDYIDMILWHRDRYPPVLIPGIEKVYVGHTITDEPKEDGKYLNIDTGIVRKYMKKQGDLTVLEI